MCFHLKTPVSEAFIALYRRSFRVSFLWIKEKLFGPQIHQLLTKCVQDLEQNKDIHFFWMNLLLFSRDYNVRGIKSKHSFWNLLLSKVLGMGVFLTLRSCSFLFLCFECGLLQVHGPGGIPSLLPDSSQNSHNESEITRYLQMLSVC